MYMKTFTCSEMGGVCESAISGGSAEAVMENGHKHVEGATDDAHNDLRTKMKEGGDEAMEEWKKGFMVKWEAKAEDA
jgi:predicted small metal-binding protein